MILPIIAYSARVLLFSSSFYFKGDTLFTEVTKKVEIMDPVGAGRYGSERIIFDKRKENINLLYARTKQPDGEIVPVTENAKNIVTPSMLSGFPEYSNIKQLVISFLDLNKGSVTEVRYIKKTLTKNRNISQSISFASRIPVDKRVVRIKVPEEKDLKYYIRGNIINKKKGNIYTFEMDSIPPIPWEEDQPPLPCFAPTIFISTLGWRDIVYEFHSILENGGDSTEKEIKNPLSWVRNNIELIDVPDSIIGRNTRTIDEIVKSGRGTIYERAKVLYSLLKNYNKNPDVVLVFDKNTYNKNIPIEKISGILIKVNHLYMNVDDVKYSPKFLYDFSGEPAIEVNQDTFKFVVLPEDPKHSNAIKENIYIDPVKKTFKAEISYTGIYGAEGRDFYEENKNELKEKIQNTFHCLGEITNFTLKNIDSLSLPLELKAEGKILPVFQGKFTILNLCQPGQSIGGFYNYNVEQNRKTPLLISENSFLSFVYNINMKGMNVYVYPESKEIVDSSYNQETSINKNKGKFILRREISFRKGIISADKTSHFKNFLKDWENPGQSIVILQKK